MNIHEQIRVMREIRHWSQEDMAGKLNMSVSGYAKIERGESKIHLDKLQKIADIFNVDVYQLMQNLDKGVVFYMANNGDNANYQAAYYSEKDYAKKIEELKTVLSHKDEIIKYKNEMIEQKDRELKALQEIISLIKSQQKI